MTEGGGRNRHSRQPPARALDRGQQTARPDQPFDRLQVAVQRPVAAEWADVLADVRIGRLRTIPNPTK